MLDRIEFLCSEAVVALRRNGWMTFAAVSTVSISLFLIGGLGFLYGELRLYAGEVSSTFTLRAFLKEGATYDDIRAAAKSMREIEGVALVQWVPKEKAWEKWRKEYPDLTEGLDNPFPDAMKIKLTDLELTSPVVSAIRRLPQVDPSVGVEYLEPEQRFLTESLGFIRWLGVLLGGLGLFTAGVLIHNAIRLAVLTRRREIRIMQLVGASHSTIRWPFVIEGAIHGALGGAVATLLLWSAYAWILNALRQYSALGTPHDLPIGSTFVWMTLAGMGYGILCSAIAVRAPLRLGVNAP